VKLLEKDAINKTEVNERNALQRRGSDGKGRKEDGELEYGGGGEWQEAFHQQKASQSMVGKP